MMGCTPASRAAIENERAPNQFGESVRPKAGRHIMLLGKSDQFLNRYRPGSEGNMLNDI